MKVAPQVTLTDNGLSEKELFWKKHATHQRESGLSRVAYCRKHQLNYDQFNYWEQKWRQPLVARELLPVNLTVTKPTESPPIETIGTLTFKNGHELKIHDKSVLPILLSIWG